MVALAPPRAADEIGRAAATQPPPRRDRAYLLAAGASAVAGVVHALLAPMHFREAVGVGLVFALVAAFQLGLASAIVRRPTPRLALVGVAGTTTLILAWLVTRAAVLPGAPARQPEPITLLGLVAVAAEVVSVVALARRLPAPRVRSRATASLYGAAAGVLFVVVFLLASGGVSYVSDGGPAPSLRFHVPSDPSSVSLIDSLSYPLVAGRLLPHVWLVGSLWSLLFAGAAGALLAGDIAARLGLHAAGATCPPARGLAPGVTLVAAVSSCCGPSLALLFGAAAVPLLFRASPWILLVTAAAFAFDLRRLRSAASAQQLSPSPIPPHGGPHGPGHPS